MIKAEFFHPRNILIIAVTAVIWQLLFSRVHRWLSTSESAQTTTA